MKLLIYLTTTAFILATSVYAQEPSKRDRVVEYFRINGIMKSIDRNAELWIKEMESQHPDISPEFWDGPELTAAIDDWKEAVLNASVDLAVTHITDEELEEMFGFLNSDLGQRFLAINLRLAPLYEKATFEVFAKSSVRLERLIRAEYDAP